VNTTTARRKASLAILVVLAGCGFEAGQSPQSGSPGDAPSTVEATATAEPVPTATVSQAPIVAEGEEWIVYQGLPAGGGDGIYLVRPDGTGTHQMVPDLAGSEIHPDWSPDGTHIAFIRINPEDRHELWVVSADGSGPEMLFSCDLPCNTIRLPAWAPDGEAIYFEQDANAPAGEPPTTFMVGKLHVASGEASVVLEREDGMSAGQPRISPDGRRVAYSRGIDIYDDHAGFAIFISDLEGGPELQLTDWELMAAYPSWTVDGRIIFNSYDLYVFQESIEASNLYVMNADGTQLQALTSFGRNDTRATQPRAAPDGSGIVFTQVDGPGRGLRRLAFIELDGTGRRWLTPEPITGTSPSLRPVADQ
jgi:Tol biopolymer transport system component